jgi:hypothetical protein
MIIFFNLRTIVYSELAACVREPSQNLIKLLFLLHGHGDIKFDLGWPRLASIRVENSCLHIHHFFAFHTEISLRPQQQKKPEKGHFVWKERD